MATVQGTWVSTFPDRENTENLGAIKGKLWQYRGKFWTFFKCLRNYYTVWSSVGNVLLLNFKIKKYTLIIC